MRKFNLILQALLIFVVIPHQLALAAEAENQNEIRLERAIGKIVRLANKSRSYEKNGTQAFWGDAETWSFFFNEYEKNIKTLPVESRVEYLWFGMWFLEFGSDPGEQFTELVATDCAEEFSKKLKHFISRHKELTRDPEKILFADKVLGAIETRKNQLIGNKSTQSP